MIVHVQTTKRAHLSWVLCVICLVGFSGVWGCEATSPAIRSYLKAVEYMGRDAWNEAIDHLTTSLDINPDFTAATVNLAICFQNLGRLDEALLALERCTTTRSNPFAFECNYNKALLLDALYRPREAIMALGDALEVAHASKRGDQQITAHLALGNILKDAQRYEDAIKQYTQCLTLNPTNLPATQNLAGCFHDLHNFTAASRYYAKAIALDSSSETLLSAYIYSLSFLARWEEVETVLAHWEALVLKKWSHGQDVTIPPWEILTRPTNPATRHAILNSAAHSLARARAWDMNVKRACSVPPFRRRLRVAYISSHFRQHPVGEFIRDLFALHNRSLVDSRAIATSPRDNTTVRQAVQHHADHFIDAHTLSDLDIAKMLRRLKIQVVVDLDGHTIHNRLSILAYHATPVALHLLGYPGTIGAPDCVEHFVTDRITTPPDISAEFYEKLLVLPQSYQLNHHRAHITLAALSSELTQGLPRTTPILCNFNQAFKLDKVTFDLWMRIMKRTGGVLWLLKDEEEFAHALVARARTYGITENQLIFAARVPMEDHISRLQACDLYLDNLRFNAHTSATDALFAGVPLVTLPGETFASRVAAGLLWNLSPFVARELIAESPDDFVERAIRIAMDPSLRETVRHALCEARESAPLFDSIGWVRTFETCLQLLWETKMLDKSFHVVVST